MQGWFGTGVIIINDGYRGNKSGIFICNTVREVDDPDFILDLFGIGVN